MSQGLDDILFWLLVVLVMLFVLHRIDFKDKVDEEDTSTWD